MEYSWWLVLDTFQPQAVQEVSGWWEAILSVISYFSSGMSNSAVPLNSTSLPTYYFLSPFTIQIDEFASLFFYVISRLKNNWLREMVSFTYFCFQLKPAAANKLNWILVPPWQRQENIQVVQRAQALQLMASKFQIALRKNFGSCSD